MRIWFVGKHVRFKLGFVNWNILHFLGVFWFQIQVCLSFDIISTSFLNIFTKNLCYSRNNYFLCFFIVLFLQSDEESQTIDKVSLKDLPDVLQMFCFVGERGEEQSCKNHGLACKTCFFDIILCEFVKLILLLDECRRLGAHELAKLINNFGIQLIEFIPFFLILLIEHDYFIEQFWEATELERVIRLTFR